MSRAATILSRFPRHMEADAPDKLFGATVHALAGELDVKTYQLGRVRRAHTLADADEERDLLRHASAHNLRYEDFEVRRIRLRALADATYADELDQLRRGIGDAIALHRAGNGTIGAVIGAGAAQLDLSVQAIAHDPERFWHLARCRDRLQPPSAPADLIALEENPFQAKDVDPAERRHGDRFRVTRGGLEPVSVTVRVVGTGDRTVWPMVMNLDAGFGVAFAGVVPDGEELRFESDGRVTMGGTDVGPYGFTVRGAVFADADAIVPGREFVFADQDAPASASTATFAVTAPLAEAFGPHLPPHAGGLLEAATMGLGESRWAFFVRAAHYGGEGDVLAVPGYESGVFDESVFADAADVAGAVGFAWQEREPFALTLWLPQRFQALDEEGQPTVAERVRLALDRHRAAGVHAYVKYADPRWSLAAGVLRELESADARGIVVVGTSLWADGTPQP